MSRLVTRVTVLERQTRRAAGCPQCRGRRFRILETGTGVSWLDASSCCRACGNGVKLYDRDLWDRLP